jgi:YjgF/chorismate_mutase-like, putative endoribonuclease
MRCVLWEPSCNLKGKSPRLFLSHLVPKQLNRDDAFGLCLQPLVSNGHQRPQGCSSLHERFKVSPKTLAQGSRRADRSSRWSICATSLPMGADWSCSLVVFAPSTDTRERCTACLATPKGAAILAAFRHCILPKAPTPLGAYVEASRVGLLLFLSGMLPLVDGKLSITGRLGENLSVEQGREAVRIAAMNALAAAQQHLGDLCDR